MFKLHLECSIVAEDHDTGYWKRQVVSGNDIYSFMISLATALFLINSEAADYGKAKEIEEMEGGELPF